MTYNKEGAAIRRRQSSSYLNQVRAARRHIEALNLEIEEHRAMASGLTGIAYDKLVVSMTPSDDAMSDAVSALLDIIRDRTEAVKDYASLLEECGTALDAMGGRDADLLRLHYLADKTLADISKSKGWGHDRQYMSVLHQAALERFTDYMPFYRREPRHKAL